MKRVKKQTEKSKKQAADGKPGRKRVSKTPSTGASSRPNFASGLGYRDPTPTMRFDATIYPPKKANPNWVNQLNIDRVPDAKGLVRALVTAADCVRLLDQGFEVRLHQAHPVRPLDPKLIENDEEFKKWLEKKLKTVSGKQ
jgi:hypothetical protein